MNPPERAVSMTKPILVAALISLAITLLRLYGEVHDWSPAIFSKKPGGGGSPLGVDWLIPILGIWFGIRLKRGGQGPENPKRAFLVAIVALVILVGCFAFTNPEAPTPSPTVKIAIITVASLLAGVAVFSTWKRLGGALVVYAYLAHLPVLVVMYVAMQQNWGTHYEKGFPGLPEMEFTTRFLVIAVLPQLVTWIGMTAFLGGFLGQIAAFFAHARAPVAAAATGA
jgi:hypothetical protein